MSNKIVKEFKNILKNDPAFIIRSAISPLFLTAAWQGEGSNNPLHIISIAKDRDTCVAINEKNYIAIAKDKFKSYFQEELTLSKLQREYYTLEKNISDFYEKFTHINSANFSNEELRDYMIKINDLILVIEATIYIENVNYEDILEVTGLEFKNNLDAVWEKATQANFISFEWRRLKKLLEIIKSNDANHIRQARFIFSDYFWVKSDLEILNELEKIRLELGAKEKALKSIISETAKKAEEYNQWLAQLDDNSRRIAEYLQLVMNLRDVRKDPIAQIQTMMAEIAVEMLKRAKIDSVFAPYTIIYEYLKGVEYLIENKENILKRKNGSVFLVYPDFSYKIELCDFDLAIKEFENLFRHNHDEDKDITGQVACKGLVRGVVKVILDPKDDKEFKNGEILVTSMTRPEFVPLMKRAGAVITNEGGITCHAAIVSRELVIPCVIGTKIATRVLKDGDLVEVDANKGIIKRITE